MFRASLCPSSGEQDCVLPHMVFCTGCAGRGCVELGRELCALCEGYCSTRPAPHNHGQHNQCRTPYAVVHSLVFLKMGIMMPETCWDRSLIINIRLVASCRFLPLHRTFMMQGHKSLQQTRLPSAQIRTASVRTYILYYSLCTGQDIWKVDVGSPDWKFCDKHSSRHITLCTKLKLNFVILLETPYRAGFFVSCI